MDIQAVKETISLQGFVVLHDVFDTAAVDHICREIEVASRSNPNFRKTADLFAIRRFLFEVPAVRELLFTPGFNSLLSQVFGTGYRTVKSIYFDKPPASNWFVAYHQDLTISVAHRVDYPGYGPWTVKQDQYAVQPPLAVLENNFTIRVHLDDTTAENGALRVIPGSHLGGIRKQPTTERDNEITCEVPCGGIMIMKPLLLHASRRSTTLRRRRVIHIEFSNYHLPAPLAWSEAW